MPEKSYGNQDVREENHRFQQPLRWQCLLLENRSLIPGIKEQRIHRSRFEDFLRKSSLPRGSDEPAGEFEEL